MIEKKEMKDKDKLADFLRNTDYTISKLFEVMYTTDESKKSFYIFTHFFTLYLLKYGIL